MSLRIDDFKAALVGGGARANYFRVTPAFPYGGDIRLGSFMIKGAQLPASNVGIIPVNFRGRQLKVAGDRLFDDWTITVINDNNFAIRNAFETWSDNISRHVSGESTGTGPGGIISLNDYYSDWTVEQLDKSSSVSKTYNIIGAWPQTIDAIDVSYDNTDTIEEFTVTMSYQYWTSPTSTELT